MKPDEDTRLEAQRITRRQFVKGATAVTGTALLHQALGPAAQAQEASYVPENLSEGELATLKAVQARLLPADDAGGGAVEARAYVYIDRALGESYAPHRETYRSGLAALDALARREGADDFATLDAEGRDAILTRLEAGEVTDLSSGETRQGIPLDAGGGTFFSLVRQHTLEGTFGDPMYGGNHDFIGWNLIGYPGVQVIYTAAEQEVNGPSEETNRSAADFGGEPVL